MKGSWVYDSVRTLEERDLFENVLESPDKNDKFLNVLGNLNIELNDILITMKEIPSIITISETNVNDNNQHLHNMNIPGYNFVGVNSRTNAGEVGIYIKQNLNFFRRQDLEFSSDGFETCFLELPRERQKSSFHL